MPKPGLSLWIAPPNAAGTRTAIDKFVRDEWIVTCFDDNRLPLLRELIDDTGYEAEITPLGDFAGRILRMTGRNTSTIATQGQTAAAVRRALDTLPEDDLLGRSAHFPSTPDLVARTLRELAHWRISQDQLLAAAESLSGWQSRLARSLVEVRAATLNLLEERGLASGTARLEAALPLPPELPTHIIPGVLVFAGTEEHPAAELWCRWLAENKIPVHLVLDGLTHHPTLVPAVARTEARLNLAAKPLGTADWTECLFDGPRSKAKPPRITRLSAADAQLECDWAVRLALEARSDPNDLILDHRIAFVAPDVQKYAPLLLYASKRLGLRLNAPSTAPLLTNGFAQFVLDLLEALSGTDVRVLARATLRGYSGQKIEQWRILESAARNAFTKGFEQWSALRSWAEVANHEFEWLRVALTWRDDAFSRERTLAEWLDALRHLIAEARFTEWAASDSEIAQRDKRAMSAIHYPLVDEAGFGSKSTLPLDQFIETARRLWTNQTVTVPGDKGGAALLGQDHVIRDVRVLVAVGLVEGTLPTRRREHPLLPDDIIHALRSQNAWMPDSRDQANLQRDKLARICSQPTKWLILSHPAADDQQSFVPSLYLDDIAAAVPTESRNYGPEHIVPPFDECRSPGDSAIRTRLDMARVEQPAPKLATEAARASVRPNFTAGVTLDHVADAYRCGFQAVFRHSLKIERPYRQRGLWVLSDLPRRAGLFHAIDEGDARERLFSALHSRLSELLPYLTPAEFSIIAAGSNRLVDGWVKREFSVRRLRRMKGIPGAPIQSGQGLFRKEISVEGRTVTLIAQADAVVSEDPPHLAFYRTSTRDIARAAWNDGERKDEFKEPLPIILLNLLLKDTPPGVTYEFESLRQRTVVAINTTFPSSKYDTGITKINPPNLRAFADEKALKRVSRALNTLELAHAQPIPGDYCKACPYAELCRFSKKDDE